jgi:hypothetical protein
MVQSLLLGVMIFLSFLLTISLFRKPIDGKTKNPCRFKISPPKYWEDGSKKFASFNIIVEKKHRYFINVPFSFKFFSLKPFKADVQIFYSVPDEPKETLLPKQRIEFRPSERNESKQLTTYVTNVIMGKIIMEIELEIEEGSPIIEFEIKENSVCKLIKEHKLELNFS